MKGSGVAHMAERLIPILEVCKFKSSPQQYFVRNKFTVNCWKDTYKEKEAGNGSFKSQRTSAWQFVWKLNFLSQLICQECVVLRAQLAEQLLPMFFSIDSMQYLPEIEGKETTISIRWCWSHPYESFNHTCYAWKLAYFYIH